MAHHETSVSLLDQLCQAPDASSWDRVAKAYLPSEVKSHRRRAQPINRNYYSLSESNIPFHKSNGNGQIAFKGLTYPNDGFDKVSQLTAESNRDTPLP